MFAKVMNPSLKFQKKAVQQLSGSKTENYY